MVTCRRQELELGLACRRQGRVYVVSVNNINMASIISPVDYRGGLVNWSNCGGGNICLGGWWRWWWSGGGGWRRGSSGRCSIVTTILSIIRSTVSVLLSAAGGVAVSSEAAKSLDNSSSDGLLEVGSSEDGHVVGWVGELEEDGEVVLGLGSSLAEGEEDERRVHHLEEGLL